jgi:hypothetical protein
VSFSASLTNARLIAGYQGCTSLRFDLRASLSALVRKPFGGLVHCAKAVEHEKGQKTRLCRGYRRGPRNSVRAGPAWLLPRGISRPLSLAFAHRRCALCAFGPFAYVFVARRRVPILLHLMRSRNLILTRLPLLSPRVSGSANSGDRDCCNCADPCSSHEILPEELSEAKPRAERP